MFIYSDTKALVDYVYLNLRGAIGFFLMLSMFGPIKKPISLKALLYAVFWHLFIPIA